ncbi:MAG: YebC/PmpR family DNA-binding transcriptional regulator [Minisyncoccia bacterium]
MAGHSHWKQIKEQKGTADKKKSQLFSKILNGITVAAKNDPNPQFNARLRSMIEQARKNNIPQENIERAIKKASTSENKLEDLIMEAYGPGGVAILITAITDNKNRTINETKSVLKDNQCKWADPGSVRWAFELNAETLEWQPKFLQNVDEKTKQHLFKIIEELESLDDIQKVYINVV